ncbi:MAG: winged helix-turn-helix transcriptional regulator [Candidatus Latescibacterota bacterium]|nr:MAG: winged helix-turn-helix transcriptional regulator [Candidatus Latescibacterota bacterium]
MTAKNERVWRTLANPQRRKMLASLRDGPKSTTELFRLLPKLTRFAVIKHIGLLRDAGLIRTKRESNVMEEKDGRNTVYLDRGHLGNRSHGCAHDRSIDCGHQAALGVDHIQCLRRQPRQYRSKGVLRI